MQSINDKLKLSNLANFNFARTMSLGLWNGTCPSIIVYKRIPNDQTAAFLPSYCRTLKKIKKKKVKSRSKTPLSRWIYDLLHESRSFLQICLSNLLMTLKWLENCVYQMLPTDCFKRFKTCFSNVNCSRLLLCTYVYHSGG